MRVVIALGGNALLRRGEPLEADVQRRNVAAAAAAIAELARAHAVVVTHGNGPQVGLLALQSESLPGVASYPLDVLGAESEGMIGYLIERELRALLPGRPIATLLTQVEVDADDPAFASPSKPIGPVYDAAGARAATGRGFKLTKEKDGFRRVVPSPAPRRILELATIRLLVEAGTLVVCAGGGGIPVVVTPAGAARGVEAVVDKDATAALLARDLRADALLLLTDQPAVFADWPERGRPIHRAPPHALRALPLERGSMAPKVEAACRFAEATGGLAAVGALEDAARMLRGEAGTVVDVESGQTVFWPFPPSAAPDGRNLL